MSVEIDEDADSGNETIPTTEAEFLKQAKSIAEDPDIGKIISCTPG